MTIIYYITSKFKRVLLHRNKQFIIFFFMKEWDIYPSVTFAAVVENCHEKKDSFLCHHPLQYFKQESLVPTIIGMNSAEGGLFASRKYKSSRKSKILFILKSKDTSLLERYMFSLSLN